MCIFQGFAPFLVPVILILIIILSATGLYIYMKKRTSIRLQLKYHNDGLQIKPFTQEILKQIGEFWFWIVSNDVLIHFWFDVIFRRCQRIQKGRTNSREINCRSNDLFGDHKWIDEKFHTNSCQRWNYCQKNVRRGKDWNFKVQNS